MSIHASCVALNGMGVVIRGPSGSGKSDLVLRLIDSAGFGLSDVLWRGTLVADDQVVLTPNGNQLIANPPLALAGKLEIRGRGIVDMTWVGQVPVHLIVDLVPAAAVARMPEVEELAVVLNGVQVPRIYLDGNQASAPARIRSFLR